MIVPMKKATVIAQAKDAESTVSDLRALGVLHVEHQRKPQGENIAGLSERIAVLDQALGILGANRPPAGKQPEPEVAADWGLEASRIVDTYKRLEQIEEFSQNLRQQISVWEPWGDFDPAAVEKLARSGIRMALFLIPEKEIAGVDEAYSIVTIFSHQGMKGCVVFSRREISLPFPARGLPKHSLQHMKDRLEEETRLADTLRQALYRASAYQASFLRARDTLEKELEFTQALRGMGQEGDFVFLRGFLPQDQADGLKATAQVKKWGLLVEEPSEEDEVPTLLREPRWVNIIKPLLKFLGVTPGYRELDVSRTFLIFFSIFFGILIGDAGYGMLYLALSRFVISKKLPAEQRPAIVLLYALSSCAILWGICTGTFFGQEWVLALGYKPLVPQLNDAKFFQAFCFFLGAVHLSIAHTWRTILRLPSLAALADTGWLLIVWSAFFLARTLILGDAFPSWGRWLIISGVSLVILFTNPQRNMLRAVGEGLGTIALGLVNSFTDVVSYIRLFAVGMAGVAIGDATNAMASSVGTSGFALLGFVVIVALGHALNLVLGPMSVLVHGVRLNVLEFSGHAGVAWAGTAYAPLRE